MEELNKMIYRILHIISCPEKDMKKLNSSADVCTKCGRMRFNFTRH